MSLPLHTVYRAREEFLTQGDISLHLANSVRPEVLSSWRRSRLSGASPDAPTLHYDDDGAVTDSALCLAADPVLTRLAERFSGLRAGVLLSDRHARIIRRYVASDSGILLQMDRISSVVGASGSEEFVGTNGIGTVAEDRRPRMVVGPEHFAEALSGFTCVGAPVHNPLTRKLEGIVTLNSDVESASPLLTPLMTSTAQEIEQRLLDLASHRERMLLDTFLIANRSGAPVAVVGEDVFMAGPRASRLLEGVEHPLIWEYVSEAVSTSCAGRGPRTIIVPATNRVVALRCSPLVTDGRLVGALLEVDEGGEATATSRPAPAPSLGPALPTWRAGATDLPLDRSLLPGVSTAWQSVLQAASTHRASDLPLLVVGEPGTGKLTVLHAMFDGPPDGAKQMYLIDCVGYGDNGAGCVQQLRQALASERPVVALRHIDILDEDAAAAISVELDALAQQATAPRVVATATAVDEWAQRPGQRRLLDQLAVARIELPPLRERREDIKVLIASLIERHGASGGFRLSVGAQLAMTRAQWPGNVRQLESVVRGLIASCSRSEVSVEMLPSGLGQYSTRRALTAMEQVELDAIMSAIRRAQGNKVVAAKLLGISRSTLYRKMRSYKLDPDKHFF